MATSSSSSSVSPTQIPVFKGDSYEFWSTKMMTLFNSQELWEFVETGIAETNDDEVSRKKNQKLDAKAHFFIQQGVDESIFSRIVAATTSKQAWTILKTEYQGSTKVITVKLQSLRRDFETFVMKGNESMQAYLARVSAIVSQMRSYGEKITDETIVAKVLRSLAPKFDHVVAAIEESKDLYTLSFDELMGSLQAHEARINRSVAKEEQKAFQIKGEANFSYQRNRGRDRGGSRGRGRGRGRTSSLHCSYCNKNGHTEKYWNTQRYIKDVNYAPNLAHNLVSVGQLMESGHSLLFDDGKCIIRNKATNEIVARAYMTENRMFPLEFSTDAVLMSKNLEEKMVANLPSIVLVKQVCEGCVLGKQTKMSFLVGKSKRATDLLELVHADLCGPMRTESLRGSRYFLLFTDDYSRMRWVYFLQLKSETFENFKKFKALVEKHSGKDLKVLRTDHGGEFISKEFAAFCNEEGIKRELTAPYTPEQNGVADRKNRTVVEMARSMLKSKELTDNFWAEGVAAAVYLLNISSTKSVWNMTPYEAWYGNKQSNDKVESSNNKLIEDEEISSKNTEEVSVEEQSSTPTRSSSSSSLSTSVEGSSPHESMPTPATQLRRSQRGHIPRCRFPVEGELDNEDDHVTLFALFVGDPVTIEEALQHEEWRGAMKDELECIQRNRTWEQADLPEGKNVIGLKWIYKTKFLADGSIEKYKARLVVRGCTQQQGIDYGKTFAPVSRFETVRMILALAAQKISQTSAGIFMSQRKYIEDTLHKFNMTECKPAPTPVNINEKLQLLDGYEAANVKMSRSLIGRLIYLTQSRPDISVAVGVLSRFMHNLSRHHFGAAKRVLHYLSGTKNLEIWYRKSKEFKLTGFTDSDWAGAIEDRKSTSGSCFILGTSVVTWNSKKQETVALSTTEAEYVAATAASCQAVWLRRILSDLREEQFVPTEIYCDSRSAMMLARNLMYHGRTKHIKIKHHYIRELLEKRRSEAGKL
nr:retrovirus-related Pol polyprotein from transposon TNT 1-94 [Tanacetum cinerariifolium]